MKAASPVVPVKVFKRILFSPSTAGEYMLFSIAHGNFRINHIRPKLNLNKLNQRRNHEKCETSEKENKHVKIMGCRECHTQEGNLYW